MYDRSEQELRVLILAPIGRDAALLQETLCAKGHRAEICASIQDLVAQLADGASTVLATEEALGTEQTGVLVAWLTVQPPWSDLPFIIMTSKGRATSFTTSRALELQVLGNVTFLERPVRPETIEAAVRTGLRARMRQYEIRRGQETLMRANEDLEHFAYTASHDLQEPIRTIAIYSELVKRKYGDLLDDIGHEFLNYINGGAKRLEKLVQDLLAYTRATAIRDELPDPESSIAAIRAAEANLSEVIRENRAEVHYEALPCVRMREVHLQQLFQNLIGNAIKYRSDSPPRVSISASMAGRFWLFQVRDNGIGISPDYKDSIFEIFNRLHTNEEYGGTGIGLAICRRIVDRYHGKIWVESEIGRGSTFFFTVPA